MPTVYYNKDETALFVCKSANCLMNILHHVWCCHSYLCHKGLLQGSVFILICANTVTHWLSTDSSLFCLSEWRRGRSSCSWYVYMRVVLWFAVMLKTFLVIEIIMQLLTASKCSYLVQDSRSKNEYIRNGLTPNIHFPHKLKTFFPLPSSFFLIWSTWITSLL